MNFFSPLRAPEVEGRRCGLPGRWRGARLVLFVTLMAMLASAPRAIGDDINPDADIPDSSTIADSSPPNQTLEIPQQCDQASVAVLCDRSSDDGSALSAV